jgi:hypothetical protein
LNALHDFAYPVRLSNERINTNSRSQRLAQRFGVNATIRTSGIKPFNIEAVSTPFRPGMPKSKRIKSGLRFMAFDCVYSIDSFAAYGESNVTLKSTANRSAYGCVVV